MTSRNQREGYYSGYFRRHYRSRFHRLGREDNSYIVLVDPVPDFSATWPKWDKVWLLDPVVECGTIDRFRFITGT